MSTALAYAENPAARSVQRSAVAGNRATHALNLPGRYVPVVDGSVSTLTPLEANGTPEAVEANDPAGGLV